MSKLFIEDSTLSAIGDAIRSKAGTTDLMSPADMVTTIENIEAPEGYIGIEENGTHDVGAYKYAVVEVAASGGGGPVKMPDLVTSGTASSCTNTPSYFYQVYDVTNYSQLTFAYLAKNYVSSTYKSKFTLIAAPGYTLADETGGNAAYCRQVYSQVDTDASKETILNAVTDTSISGTKTYDVSNMTSFVIELRQEKSGSYPTGSMRVYDIVLS